MMQVRGLLAGQDWFDLRQYRLDPPFGANVHWSRLVDLPIAGIMLVLRPLVGGPLAEKAAVAIAPLIPMAIAMAAIAVTSRRLLSPKAFAVGIALLLCAHSARGMWSPLRIDHHGWQLAMLSLAIAALADKRPARGGLLLGAATAVSLTIGLELLVYLAAGGAALVLMWVRDPVQGRRLATYGASLAGGCALGYLLFTSYDNRQPVCDALSPVWLSVMVAAGAIAVVLPFLPLQSRIARFPRRRRLGCRPGGRFRLLWPHCLGRLEGLRRSSSNCGSATFVRHGPSTPTTGRLSRESFPSDRGPHRLSRHALAAEAGRGCTYPLGRACRHGLHFSGPAALAGACRSGGSAARPFREPLHSPGSSSRRSRQSGSCRSAPSQWSAGSR
jgi:hypothetical protein